MRDDAMHDEDRDLDPAAIGPRAAPDGRLLAAVAAHFGLGPPLASADLGGAYNLNLRVETARGAYVVRVYRPWVTRDRLACLHRVRRALADAGLPVPRPLAAPAGDAVAPYGDRLAEAERFVPHDAGADTRGRYAVAFALLGRLHDALAAAVPPETIVPPRVSNYGTPPLLRYWIGRTERRLRDAAPDETVAHALAVCAEARALLGPMEDWWRAVGAGLPRQPIHGDYGGGNLLFADGRPAAILDFDLLGVRERVYEVAYSLYWMLVRLAGDDPPDRPDWAGVREMLASYNAATARPLGAAETRSLPLVMARVPLYWVAEACWLPDPARAVAAMAPTVRFARRLTEHGDELPGGVE